MKNERYLFESKSSHPEKNMSLEDLKDYLYKNAIYLNIQECKAIERRIEELEILKSPKERLN